MKINVPNLPLEVQGEILKNLPNYPRISKKTYDPNLYYKQYCHKPISEQEFINYINTYNPKKFIVYVTAINDEDMPEMNIFLFNNKKHVDSYMLTIDNIDVEEYSIHNHYFKRDYNDIESFLDEIYYSDIYYDVLTTFNILNLRECQKINPNYSKQYTIDIVNEKTPNLNVDNMYSFYELCKKLIYLHTNQLLLHDKIKNVLAYSISNITFDGLGEIIDDTQYDKIQTMIDHYTPYKTEIIDLINYL